MKSVLKAPRTMLLKLRYDEPLSSFAFNFNLRHCTKDAYEAYMNKPEKRRSHMSAGVYQYLPAGAYTRPLLSSI